ERAPDLVDCVEHRAAQGEQSGAPAAAFIDARGPLERARRPPAVARRCPVTGELALEHYDVQRRQRTLDVVGAPQPRVAGADDRYVRLAGPIERRARVRDAAERAPPEAELA